MRRSEEALRRSERDFRALAENLPDVVARYDRQLRHVYVNRAIERATGIPVEDFLGKTHAENVPDELVQQFHAAQREVLATAEPRILEFTFPAKDAPRHFECRLFPEFGPDGSVESILSISRDVTDRLKAQEQADQHLAQLAHVSRLSTIGELVSEIAHEINQPLHAIVNFAQASINVLEKLPADGRANLFGWLKQISEQANRAAEIIRRARRFVRKSSVNRSTIDVNEIVRDCLKLVNFDLRIHHVKLRCELASGLPSVLADGLQVQQVLAVEAMAANPAENRRLSVRTIQADAEVRVSVRDNGRGIASDEAPRLFEPFFTTKAEGMGMGLAVSQSIVQAHSGRLWAEPNADRGVTFHFTLPVRKQEPSHVYAPT
jgi:PAS domain S-box-containing protein